MKGILSFNLLDSYEREEFEAAQKGSHYKMKIDDLYTEVFRPHFKHGHSFIGITEDPSVEFKLDIDSGELLVDSKIASEIEGVIVEAIWKKVHEHFKGEDE